MDTDPPKPPARRQGHPLRLVVLVVVATAVVLGVVYKRVYSKRTAVLRTQQACLEYERQADQVVYEENESRAQELVKRGGEFVSLAGDTAGGPPVAGHVPEPWRAMLRWAMPAGRPDPDAAVLFLHERQTPAGKLGLVCVEADRVARRLRVTFIHPGASTLDPVPVTDVAVIPRPQEGLVLLTPGGDPFESRLPPESDPPTARADLRFFAGQPDPKDPTQFTLPYERNGRRGELEMSVENEQTVYFYNRQFAER
jgi:hypothetical protein